MQQREMLVGFLFVSLSLSSSLLSASTEEMNTEMFSLTHKRETNTQIYVSLFRPVFKRQLREQNLPRANKQLANTCTAHLICYDAVNQIYAVVCSQLAVVTSTTTVESAASGPSAASTSTTGDSNAPPHMQGQGQMGATLTTEEKKRTD